MSIEENRAIARKNFEEAWNKGRVELLDEYYAVDVPPSDPNHIGEIKKGRLRWHKAAPGFVFTVLDTVAEGDKVMVYWEVEVTYSIVPDPPPDSPMMPLGKPVKFRGMEIFHFADGKVVKRDVVNEWMRMMVGCSVYTLAKPEPA